MHTDTAGVPSPVTDPVPELLEQLVAHDPRCLYCQETIGLYDMLVAWPAADVIAHFACYAAAQHLVKDTAGGGGAS